MSAGFISLMLVLMAIITFISIFSVQRNPIRIALLLSLLFLALTLTNSPNVMVAWFSPILFLSMGLLLISLCLAAIISRKPLVLNHLLAMLGTTSFVAVAALSFQWYQLTRYTIHDRVFINERSYHIVVDEGFLDPAVLEVFACTPEGIFCSETYQLDRYVDVYSFDNGQRNRNEFGLIIADDNTLTITKNGDSIDEFPLE